VNSEAWFRQMLASAGIAVNGGNAWDIPVYDHRLYSRVRWNNNLGLGDAYFNGLWGCSALDQFFTKLLTSNIEERVGIPRVVAAGTLLEPEALTLGFARRFTGYKRPELVFHDPERLARILNAAGRPVQIIFAGKSHPADDIGKPHLQRVYKRALDPQFGGRIAFVDDYDLHVAHFLVHGCDVWLNNPRRFLEASGTSGMKAGANGVLNCSVPDGWWDEGYSPEIGWAIPSGATLDRPNADDPGEAEVLYRVLEREVIPLYYQRDPRGLPVAWLAMMRASIRRVATEFSARRLVTDYFFEAYAPAARRVEQLRLRPDWGV